MRTISHPLRLDSSGSVVTIDDGTDRQAAELAGVVTATGAGERGLAPEYGLADPTATGVSQDTIAAAIARCEPELDVISAAVNGSDNTATVALTVIWAE